MSYSLICKAALTNTCLRVEDVPGLASRFGVKKRKDAIEADIIRKLVLRSGLV